jgi:hypothetical protein
MHFEELKEHLQETLILTQKVERFWAEKMPSASERNQRFELYKAKMAELERRTDESMLRLRKSYNRLMRKRRGQQPPPA